MNLCPKMSHASALVFIPTVYIVLYLGVLYAHDFYKNNWKLLKQMFGYDVELINV